MNIIHIIFKQIVYLSILVVCHFSLYSTIYFKGTFPQDYQLLTYLTTCPLEKLDGYHREWITQIEKDIRNNHKSQLVKSFDRVDACEILVPLLRFHYNFELNREKIDNLFDTVIIPQQEPITIDISKFKEELVAKELYNAAITVSSFIEGNCLLILGQTPAYLGEVVKIINEYKGSCRPQTIIISVCYSGRPDTVLTRFNKNKAWNWTESSFQEIVTTHREECFRFRMQKQGFDPKIFHKNFKKIYILDNSRGPSLASFLLLLNRWYKDLKSDLPDISFIAMDNNEQALDLRVNNNCVFKVDTFYLNMDQRILNNYFDKVGDELRLMPPFSAYCWRSYNAYNYISSYPRYKALDLIDYYKKYTVEQLKLDKNLDKDYDSN